MEKISTVSCLNSWFDRISMLMVEPYPTPKPNPTAKSNPILCPIYIHLSIRRQALGYLKYRINKLCCIVLQLGLANKCKRNVFLGKITFQIIFSFLHVFFNCIYVINSE